MFSTSSCVTLPVTSAEAVFTSSAPAPETVTWSLVAPISSFRSRCAGWAVSTVRSVTVVVLNPLADTEMVYVPACKDWNEYTPSLFVTVPQGARVLIGQLDGRSGKCRAGLVRYIAGDGSS